MNVLPKTNVTWMPLVLTPKDLTTAPVKMDLKATGKTAKTLMNVLPQTNVTWMPLVQTPKDLTAAPVKMDLKATGNTAQQTQNATRTLLTKKLTAVLCLSTMVHHTFNATGH